MGSPMKACEKTRHAFGQRVRQYRQARGWQLDDLAERIGTTRVSMSRIENGKQNLTFDAMVAISEALAVPLADLVGAVGSEHIDEPERLRAQAVVSHCARTAQEALHSVSLIAQQLEALAPVTASHAYSCY